MKADLPLAVAIRGLRFAYPGAATTLAVERFEVGAGEQVFTVGFGTKDGEVIGFEGWTMRVRLDEDTLPSLACFKA